jgi:multidrug resistance efflux pump
MDQKHYIFPKEIIENTAEFHFHSHNTYSTAIYKAVLVFLVAAVLAILFIKVDVNVKSTGMFRSVEERNDIKPLINGRIDSIFIRENSRVKAGQVLLTIKGESISGKNEIIRLQQSDVEDQLSDLDVLINAYKRNNWPGRPDLKSGVYRQQYRLFRQRIAEAQSRKALATKNHERFLYLYKNKAVSALEYDQVKMMLDNVSNELSLISENQDSKWQSDLNALRTEYRDLSAQNKQYTEEKDFYTLRASVSGSVQNLKGMQSGSLISANELLGEISPDSGLIAETYVLPKDIGLLKVGTKAKIQIDAYNYNQWGLASGKVISISGDIYMDKGAQPYFKVRCLLDTDRLRLKNGYVGKIKKGMSLQARFLVTRRTLFQLLYDQVDDWLNPNVMPGNVQKNAGL